jgi:alpha-galactosidase
VVYYEGTYDEVFDKYFANFNMPETRNGLMTGYTSWYNYFQKIDEKIILRDLEGLNCAKNEVNIFQIDDGYETFVGDWLDHCEKFPNGMKYVAEKVHAKGYKAGIWIAPFSCQRVSRTAKEHPDWLIKDENMLKVLEGNYDNKIDPSKSYETEAIEQAIIKRMTDPPKTAAEDENIRARAEALKQQFANS